MQWTVWPKVRLDVDGLVVLPMESDDERDPLVFEGKSATVGQVRQENTEVTATGG